MRHLTRRGFLAAGAALGMSPLLTLPRPAGAAAPRTLTAAPAVRNLAGAGHPDTPVWAYDGAVPGPVLSWRRGDRLSVRVVNQLPETTTAHFHGVRMPIAMDGVPGISQPPIEPGDSFLYDFDLPDAGTFWYHPHINSAEQVGRGLAGVLVVHEDDPPAVDRDVVWVLDDWRLDDDGAIAPFGMRHDEAHAGRLGNTATVNGEPDPVLPARSGERVRLRLVNAANARVFALEFGGHRPTVVALDGQPCTPHRPDGDRVVLAPAQRVDLVIDMEGDAGSRHEIVDGYYPRQRYRLADIAYAADPPVRDHLLDAPAALPANPLPRPAADSPHRLMVSLGGGAMFGMRSSPDGDHGHAHPAPPFDLREAAARGLFWALNGHAHGGDDVPPPLASFPLGATVFVVMHNHTEWDHPMHLHGHAFRVLTRNGQAVPHDEWRDTVLVAPHETVEIAFVADNPGDWMFHCHILEHQVTGMMGVLRIA